MAERENSYLSQSYNLRHYELLKPVKVKEEKQKKVLLNQTNPDDFFLGLKVNIKRQDTKDHHCTLLGEPRDIVTKYIESGLFVHSRRSFKRSLMINVEHPFTKYFAPSIRRLKDEEHKHIVLFYYMIHPLSLFNFYFEVIMCFIILVKTILLPLIIMIYRDRRDVLFYVFTPFNISFLIMIFLNFCTGIYDIKNNVVILKRSQAAWHYLTTYFLFDVLSILPQFLRSSLAILMGINYNVGAGGTARFIVPILILVHYVRYFWCLRILKQIRLYFNISSFTSKLIKLVIHCCTTLFLSVYLLYSVLVEFPDYATYTIAKHVEQTLKMLLMVSYGHPVFKTSGEVICPAIFIFMGFLLHLLLMVQGMDIWFRYFSIENKENTIYTSSAAYMRYRALPIKLRERIYTYLNFKYQGHFYKESVIRKSISPSLKREIFQNITNECINKVQLFEKCPGMVLKALRSNLTGDIFLPDDVIIRAGTLGHCMFFLLAGTVVVSGPTGKKICYLRDGAHFGEVALVINTTRVADVIALTPCEVFKLDRSDFWDVMKNYPEIYQEIKLMATDRLAKVQSSLQDISLNQNQRIFSHSELYNVVDRSFEILGDENGTRPSAGSSLRI